MELLKTRHVAGVAGYLYQPCVLCIYLPDRSVYSPQVVGNKNPELNFALKYILMQLVAGLNLASVRRLIEHLFCERHISTLVA